MSKNMSNEGRRNAARAHSSVVSQLLNDNINYRTELERKGIKPKNHHKDNLNNIKNIQLHAKEKKTQEKIEQEQKNKRFKLSRFSNIESKVKLPQSPTNKNTNDNTNTNTNYEHINHIAKNKENIKQIESQTRPQTQATSQSNTNSISISNNNNYNTQQQKKKRKASIPTREELKKIDKMISNKHNQQTNNNYVSQNRQKAIRTMSKKTETKETRFIDKEDYGKIPDYIIQRRLEMAEKKRKQMEEKEKNKIPKGMRKMEEHERLETLELLNKNKKEVELAISKLPLTIETPSMIRHEKNLRKQLKDIEDAIKIFSKKIVLIAETSEP